MSSQGDVIRIEDRYYILASSDRVDARSHVLKQGETFAVFDRHGDVHDFGAGEQGLYHGGTRHLSRLTLAVAGSPLLLLGSTIERQATLLVVDLMNGDTHAGGALVLPRGRLHVRRSKFLWDGIAYETVDVLQYGVEAVDLELGFAFDADFADVFEVRGLRRARRGQKLPALDSEDGLTLRYLGLDGVERRTRIRVEPPPRREGPNLLVDLHLEPRKVAQVRLTIACEPGSSGIRCPPSMQLAGPCTPPPAPCSKRACSRRRANHGAPGSSVRSRTSRS